MPRQLSRREAEFLANQRIRPEWVYQRVRERSFYEAIHAMRFQDKYVLHGFSPCEACGLALRSRRGDCLYCHGKQLEHIWRATEPGYVYLLFSVTLGLTKAGSTERDPWFRARQLNDEKHYGGVRDWFPFDWAKVRRRGVLEEQLKAKLSNHAERVWYQTRWGQYTWTRETYRIGAVEASTILNRVRRGYLQRHRYTSAT